MLLELGISLQSIKKQRNITQWICSDLLTYKNALIVLQLVSTYSFLLTESIKKLLVLINHIDLFLLQKKTFKEKLSNKPFNFKRHHSFKGFIEL